MKLLSFLLFFIMFITRPLQAEGEPLRVAIEPVNPPFVMQGANNQFYGYDISMMEYICKTLHRTCEFIPIRFNKILEAVNTKKVDVAASSIIITAERARIVNFSLPYLLSKAQFIGPKALTNQPFGLNLLNGRRIGITEGSIFPDVIKKMGIKNPNIIAYTNLNYLIDDLYNGKIDLGLLDEPSALYWQGQSAGKLAALGQSINYGNGIGIAVNRDNLTLLRAINNTLLKYQESDDFKNNYHTYLTHF